MLNGKFFEIFSAKNTKEAETLLETHRIDLIVCDVMMPEEDGITFCGRIKGGDAKYPS